MKTSILGAMLLCSAVLRAQDSVIVMRLDKNYATGKHPQTIPFNRVVVIDNRFDTVRLRMEQDGQYPLKVVELAGTASRAISGYLEDAVHGLPAADRTLVLDLQQFRFGNSGAMLCPQPRCPQIRHCLFISIDAYLSDGGTRLYRICSFRKPVVFDFYDLKYLTKAVASGLSELLKAIETAPANTDSVFQYSDLSKKAIERWSAYPVNRIDSVGPDGIYCSFDDFLANKVSPARLSLKLTPDSVFDLRFDGRRTTKFRQKKGYPRVWGVRYHGKRYIGIRNPYILFSKNTLFLPLESKNNTVYFRIPTQWPNMYSMLSTGSVDFEPAPENSSDDPNWREHNRRSEDQIKRILKVGMGPEHRDCFLDMDSGDIVYN